MKTKQIIIILFIAILGGLIGGFAPRFFRKEKKIIATIKQPVGFAYLPNDSALYNFNFVYAAEKSVEGVVHVKTQSVRETAYNPLYEFFYGDSYREPEPVLGFGSGVIITDDGYIVTNNHVVENSNEVYVTLNDKREFKAEIIGTDPSTDLALLKIKEKSLPFIKFGNSDELRIGEWVLAVGNPYNLTSTVTAGIVSAKGRNLGIIQDRYRMESFIQTDAALNRGNSGGALVNIKGELVGINTAILSPSGTYSGNSFAVPVSIVTKVVSDLIEFGVVQRAILGVSIQEVTADLAKEYDLKKIEGVFIAGTTEGGAAQKAGIQEGDIIIKVDNTKVNSPAELQEKISSYRPNDKVLITIKRNSKMKQFNVTLRNLQGTTSYIKSATFNNILGARFEELTDKEKTSLGIKYGVKVAELGAGKLRAEGVKEGFIITQINNKPIYSVRDLEKTINSIRGGVYIEGIYKNGMISYYAFGL